MVRVNPVSGRADRVSSLWQWLSGFTTTGQATAHVVGVVDDLGNVGRLIVLFRALPALAQALARLDLAEQCRLDQRQLARELLLVPRCRQQVGVPDTQRARTHTRAQALVHVADRTSGSIRSQFRFSSLCSITSSSPSVRHCLGKMGAGRGLLNTTVRFCSRSI